MCWPAGRPPCRPTAAAWQAILLLTVVTFVSRLALFTGVKHLGGLQTALIGLSELLVTVLAAFVLLGDKLTAIQWLGAALLAASVLLVIRENRLGTLPTPRAWTPLMLGRLAGHSGPIRRRRRLPGRTCPSRPNPSARPNRPPRRPGKTKTTPTGPGQAGNRMTTALSWRNFGVRAVL